MNPLSLHVADGLAHLILTYSEPRIDDALLAGLHAALDRCEAEGVSVLILRGQPTVFCAGGDFGALVESGRTDPGGGVADPAPLYDLWLRLTEAPFVSVSVVRGRVNAGGVGLVAATDLVIAEPGASFALSELLFGLFPACVLPFLVRRVGAQRAHQLTLTTRPLPAREALDWALVDVLDEDLEGALRRQLLRLRRVGRAGLLRYRAFRAKLQGDPRSDREAALAANRAMFADEDVRRAIRRYVESGRFPWES